MKLFHGSKIPGIRTLRPTSQVVFKGKKVVFATNDKAYALSMICGTGDELAVSYSTNNKTGIRELYIDELKPNKLNLLDNDGYLYEVEQKYFEPSPELLEGEFVSFTEVPVRIEKKISNILNELKALGVFLIRYSEVPGSMKKRGKNIKNPPIEHSPDRFK